MGGIIGSESREVRIGHSLSEAEQQYLAKRRETVLQCLKQHNILCSKDEVPNIAVLGSGGGLRAMVGLLGSLSQLKEDALLDCIMYLSGISGSTWCMASLYKEPDWSTNLKTVKHNITQRLAEGSVRWWEMGHKLVKYYSEKHNFSLTDVWAALIVSKMVKEIDEHTLSEQRGKHTNDPYPIYSVIDKQCKYDRLNTDVWFEITPDESGYSLTGAFVDSHYLGSQFKNGEKKNDQPESDMLYLQGLCASMLADMEEILKALYHLIMKIQETIQENPTLQPPAAQKGCQVLLALLELNLHHLRKEDTEGHVETINELLKEMEETNQENPTSQTPAMEKGFQELLRLVELNLHHLRKEDTEGHLEDINERGSSGTSSPENQMTSGGTVSETDTVTLPVHSSFLDMLEGQNFWDKIWITIIRSIEEVLHWIWGKTYNFLNEMSVKDVDPSVLLSETREYEDTAAILNAPYFSFLRKERDIDLIISLDFSEKDPFKTVFTAAKICKDLQIPFPEVVLPPGEKKKPKDFYVFKDNTKAPTVIHIPLFNEINCKGEIEKWRKRYATKRMNYSHNDIRDLLEKSGSNIKSNKENLLKEISYIVTQKQSFTNLD
ncbi:cytosolic phospholipase A2 gamma-like [Colossoma macropomum]|uniref:cytosolic phospholipase A2 gamma-like n=1 Tax=Colossoma macropomum TaxID=42526 RepID=UPI001864FEEF|nr:cytosolic phospholipase A2 gamma-like [Colossoma macropomum]